MSRLQTQRAFNRQENMIKSGTIEAGPLASQDVSVPKSSLGDKVWGLLGDTITNFKLPTVKLPAFKTPGFLTAKPKPTATPMPTVTPTRSPTITPTPTFGTRIISQTPWREVTRAPTPTPALDDTGHKPYFDYLKYANVPNMYQPGLAQPPANLGREIMTQFDADNEATKAALVALSENYSRPFDTEGYNFNTPGDKRITPGFEGSGDYGSWQINSKTMEDYIRRMPKEMANIGISKVEDLKDPIKSTKFAKLIRKYQGFGAWKGWQDKGITWK